MLRQDDEDRGRARLSLRLLQSQPLQLGRLQDDLGGVGGGKDGLGRTGRARTGLGSVFLEKSLFLSPESRVQVAVEDN